MGFCTGLFSIFLVFSREQTCFSVCKAKPKIHFNLNKLVFYIEKGCLIQGTVATCHFSPVRNKLVMTQRTCSGVLVADRKKTMRLHSNRPHNSIFNISSLVFT